MNVAAERHALERMRHDIETTERHIDELRNVIFVLEEDEDGVLERHPMEVLEENLAAQKEQLQKTYENLNSPKYLRNRANFTLGIADFITRHLPVLGAPPALHPEELAEVRARIARHRQSGAEYQREYQRIAEAQRELTRGLRAVELPPLPEDTDPSARKIPADLVRHLHSYGYGAPARGHAALELHAAQGAAARAAVLG